MDQSQASKGTHIERLKLEHARQRDLVEALKDILQRLNGAVETSKRVIDLEAPQTSESSRTALKPMRAVILELQSALLACKMRCAIAIADQKHIEKQLKKEGVPI